MRYGSSVRNFSDVPGKPVRVWAYGKISITVPLASIMASATPLLFLYDVKEHNYLNNNWFNDFGHYSEWPKVADAVIKAVPFLPKPQPGRKKVSPVSFNLCPKAVGRPWP